MSPTQTSLIPLGAARIARLMMRREVPDVLLSLDRLEEGTGHAGQLFLGEGSLDLAAAKGPRRRPAYSLGFLPQFLNSHHFCFIA